MMLQTNHCLLYLSVSFTHLKRSTDSVILIGVRTLPFRFWIDLKVAAQWTVLAPAIHLFPASFRMYAHVCACVYIRSMCAQAFDTVMTPLKAMNNEK